MKSITESGHEFEVAIIDDNSINRKILELILKPEKYKLHTFSTGTEALNKIHKLSVSLVLLNSYLPDIHGFQVCRSLKADPETADIPVIFISASEDLQSIRERFASGGVDYLEFPFRNLEVLSRVKTHITLFHTIQEYQKQKKNLSLEIEKNLQIQTNLMEFQAQFDKFINASSEAIFLKDDQFRYLLVNNAMTNFFGRNKEEILKKTDQELAGPNKILPCRSSDQKLLDTNSSCIVEETLGNKIYEVNKFPVELKNNKRGIGGILRDISQQKETQEKLSKFRMAIESSADAFFITDINGIIEYVNPSFEKIYGYKPHEAIGQTPRILKSGILSTEDYTKFWQILLSKKPFSGELKNKAKNGNLITVESTNNPILNDSGEIVGFISINRDITKRKKEEEERTLFRMLIDGSTDAIEVLDPKTGKFIDVNEKGCVDLGYSREEFLKLSVFDVDPVAEPALFEAVVEELYRVGHKIWEGIHVRKDGTSFPVEVNIRLVKLDRDYMVTVVRDITARQKSQELILKLSRAVEQSPVSILITDADGIIQYANPKVCEITGYTQEELIGQKPSIFKSGNKSAEEYQELWKTITSGNIWKGEFQNQKKSGEIYWELATISPIMNDKGAIINYIAIKENTTELKETNEQLRQALEKANESDRLKTSFLANMSHEVRTPLNSIIGFSELLDDSDFDETQKHEFIQQIIANSHNLLTIISDIMDISKLEVGELKIYKRKIELSKFMPRLMKQNDLLSGKNKIPIFLDNPENLVNAEVYADPDRLNQIFNNLISNALKFTHEGEIHLGIRINEDFIEFYVKDSGIGIPQEFQEVIFDRFRQVDSNRNRNYGGNGLGLAITKNLLELMNGKIWLESEPNKGTTFFFKLPLFRDELKINTTT